MHSTVKFQQIVSEAKKTIQEVTLGTVQQKLQAAEPFYLVDVREDHEWLQGHIPSAVHIGKGILERDIEKHIPDPNAEIILYCGGGHRSALAAQSLVAMGYNNVYSMDGGIRAWLQSQLDIAVPQL